MAPPSLVKHFWPCIEVLIEWINSQKKMTYEGLADRLGLALARQQWDSLLNLVADKAKRELGEDFDLTWNVVYKSGPAEGLGRYFSNGGKSSGSTLLDPKDMNQVSEFERTLRNIYAYTY